MIGLDSRFFDLYDKPDEVNAIDLDANTITLATSLKEFSSHLLPKRPAKKLRNTLEKLREKLAEQIKKARELEAHNDETIDFEFKMKKPAMLLEMEIREAFLVFMVSFFFIYLLQKKYIFAAELGSITIFMITITWKNVIFDQIRITSCKKI